MKISFWWGDRPVKPQTDDEKLIEDIRLAAMRLETLWRLSEARGLGVTVETWGWGPYARVEVMEKHDTS